MMTTMAKCQLPAALMRPILLTVNMQMNHGGSFKRKAASSVDSGSGGAIVHCQKGAKAKIWEFGSFADSFDCKNGSYNADWQLG